MAFAADESPRPAGGAGRAADDGDAGGGSDHFRIGRYELFDRIASGGMASVYFGRVVGGGGFRRAVALKRLHPHLATETSFVSMLRDEARLASRIRHRSVVPVLDVVDADGEFLLVMELVDGPPLGAILDKLRAKGEPMPLPIASGILRGALAGLGAAHDAKDESGAPLDLVHRDVSPQNVLVGVDGIARVVDFGIAKARGRIQTTDDGRLKGNFAYMAPEQAKRTPITRRADLYVVGILLWECVTGKRLHPDEDAAAILTRVLYEDAPAPSDFRDVSPEVDALLARALAREPDARFATAAQMSDAMGAALGTAGPGEVAEFLKLHMADEIAALSRRIERVETAPETDAGLTKVEGAAAAASASVSSPPGAASVPPSESPARVTAVVADVPMPAPPRARRGGWGLAVVALSVVAAAAFVVSSRHTPDGASTPTSASATTSATPAMTVTTTTASASGAPVPSTSVVASESVSPPSSSAPVAMSAAPPSSAPPSAPPILKHRPRPKPMASASTTLTTPTVAASASARTTPTGLEGIPRDRE